jgi:SSS family solute:Na+ symporter
MEHFLTFTSFIFFTGLVGVLTWLLTRRDDHASSGGYFLAGRSLTGGYIAGSLLLTNLSTEQLVGLNGSAYADGLCVMAWEVVAACSLVVLALLFLPRYLKSGIATVPQFLEERFDPVTRTLTTLIFLLAYVAILLPMILYTGARGMTDILDMPALTGIQSETVLLWGMVWLIGILGSIYAIFGGLRTVAVSDTLNGFGLLVGGLLITWLGLMSIGAGGPVENLQVLVEQHPEKFNSLGGPRQSVPFSTLFTGVLLLNLFYWTTNQQIIQRTFAARSLADGQKGILLAGVFKLLAPLILVIPGIVAFHLYGGLAIDGVRHNVVEVVEGGRGLVLRGTDGPILLQGAAAEQALSNGASTPPAVGDRVLDAQGQERVIEQILPAGTTVTEHAGGWNYLPPGAANGLLPPRNRDKAYGKLVQSVLPWYLRGFFAAVIVGAILSSFNSVLNSSATLFSLGVYRDLLHRQATDQQVIQAGKWFGGIVAVMAMLLAPQLAGQESIFGYLQKMNGIYFIPIFSIIVIGMTTRRVPAVAAQAGLICSFAAILAAYFVPQVSAALSGIHDFHVLGLVFAGSVGLMLLLGKIFPSPTPFTQRDVGAVVMTPWPWAWPLGLGLVTVVLAVYLWLADFSVVRS